jgi:chitin disaccharide deacetylase
MLVVNADDFGLSAGVNRGIVDAHERGIVTSTSLMVRGKAAGEAVERSRSVPALSVGLHVDLGEWIFRGETWIPLYEVVPLDSPDRVSNEIHRQLDAFRALVGREPSHIDSHQHVHQREPVRSCLVNVARQLGVPLRHETPGVSYCGSFYGQTTEGEPLPDAISVKSLLAIIASLRDGITELCCHPGYMDEGNEANYPTMYAHERASEVGVLCDPSVTSAVHAADIQLCSFADIGGRL